MYRFILIIFICAFSSCTDKNMSKRTDGNMKDTLMNVDRDFSRMSVEKNVSEAFIYFAAEDVILMREKELPIVGFDTLKKYFEKRKYSKSTLSWEPLKADVNSDLGYTFGSWKLDAKADDGSDTTVYGLYSTVWKKQQNGKWKFVLDCGNQSPSKFEMNK
jgi:ketosteroid isomerase-like protein